MPSFTYSDIDPNFAPNLLTGDVNAIYDVQAIINSCTNLIMTRLYTRPFQPELGSGIENELFENINKVSSESIKIKCENIIKSYEPRVESVSVSVAINSAQNGYDVIVTILPKNSLNQTTFTIQLLTRVI